MVTASFFYFLLTGAFFGLTAGISPGPLLTLVISETLKHGIKGGIKIAVAPLITDLPIILIASFVFSELSQSDLILGLISFMGAVFFIYLGIGTIRTREQDKELGKIKTESLKKGITANMLNPHPYLFWLTVGIPTAFKAYETSLITAVLYFLLFYIMLVGSKISVAFMVEKSRNFFKNRIYTLTMQILGITLFVFAAIFIIDGIRMLKDFSF
jgi:threonine/homoserine/homoserine lactone efflux protein